MKVLIFPKDVNPYQDILYERLIEQYPNVTFSYLKGSRFKFLIYPLIFLIKRLQGYDIFHIHWLEFSTSLTFPFSKYLSYYYTAICLMTIKLLGYKIVWTVHDIIPHEEQTTNDLGISIMLSKMASIKIAHSSYTISQMEQLGLDHSNTVVIPHGNYINAYPQSISKKQARNKLGISSEEFVILFFGMIKPYKGILELISAYDKIKSRKSRLVIAGKCIDPTLYNAIMATKKSIKFDFYEGYVKDDDVAMYFKACDIVCLPFREITTSGSALLALSFGKPIIAPRIGALIDLPDNVGYLYNPTKPNSLLASLRKAIESKSLNTISISASRYASSLSWDKIADQTYFIYQSTQKTKDLINPIVNIRSK